YCSFSFFFFFQAEDGIRVLYVTGVQTCALPISCHSRRSSLQTPLPINVDPKTAGASTMNVLNDMIEDGWVEGAPYPDHRGTGFITIHVVKIRELGYEALAGDTFLGRLTAFASKNVALFALVVSFMALTIAALSWLFPRAA